jgi:hypothetical protein
MTAVELGWLAPYAARADAAFFGKYRYIAGNIADQFPRSIATHMREGWENRLGQTTRENGSQVKVANTWVAALANDLKQVKLTSAYDEQRIRDHAENYANLCGRMRAKAGGFAPFQWAIALQRREAFARGIGVDPPNGKTITLLGAMKRLEDAMWWRRQLRKVWTRAAENNMRELGIIRKGSAPYASDEAVHHRAGRARRMQEWLASNVMVNGEGEQLELLELAEKSLANPALRRGEFMCRMRGFEEIAHDLRHVAEFLTLTAPSAFHATHASGGTNRRHTRETVREAQEWLCKMWSRARAKLKRLKITVYGFRVAEPHHDATPHWHMVLFCAERDANKIREVISDYWLQVKPAEGDTDYRNELKLEDGQENETAIEARRKFVRIDPGQGSATGYVAKYVSKSIDGAGAAGEEISDETGERIIDSIARVGAWATSHGIRQFQQLGGPPVGLWRECRRKREAVEDADIERARKAADRGDWRGFIYALSHDHIRAGRRTNVKLEKHETGEKNHYGEDRPARIIGLRCASSLVLTRPHTWRIERKCTGTAALSSGDGSSKTGSSTGCAGTRTAAAMPSGIHGIESGSDSDLGPVAITVRTPDLEGSYDWIATVPYRPEPIPLENRAIDRDVFDLIMARLGRPDLRSSSNAV